MDAKERWLIQRIRRTIASGTYTERDVLTMLIILRDHATSNTPVREFGDFVAHRARDKGVVQRLLERGRCVLRGAPPTSSKPVALPAFSVVEIRRSINHELQKAPAEVIDDELANKVTVCIISLLQSTKIKTQSPIPVGGFAVGVSSDFIALLGHGKGPGGHVFEFPMLLAKNSYEPIPNLPGFQFMRYPNVVEACCVDGTFGLVQQPDPA